MTFILFFLYCENTGFRAAKLVFHLPEVNIDIYLAFRSAEMACRNASALIICQILAVLSPIRRPSNEKRSKKISCWCPSKTRTSSSPDLEEPGFARIRERDELCITVSFVPVLSDQHTRLGVIDLSGPVARYLPPNLTFVNFANKGKTR